MIGDNDSNPRTNGEALAIRLFVPPIGAHVWDVGANRGDWTKLVLEHCPNAQIIAFEPGPVYPPPIPNVFVRQQALSDVPGVVALYQWQDNTLASCYKRKILGPVLCTAPAYATTIDLVMDVNQYEDIDYVKVDVEGNERKVIAGAMNTLRQGRINHLQFEYGGTWQDAGTKLQEIWDLCYGSGRIPYEMGKITPTGILWLDSREDWGGSHESYQYSNWLLKLRSA